MNHMKLGMLGLVLAASLLPAAVNAQEYDSFNTVLRETMEDQDAALIEQANATETDPALGSTEKMQPEPVAPAGTGEPYNAGRDYTSGIIAAGAVILCAIAVVLLLLLVGVWGFGKKAE